jgi:hypothetical protein
MPRVPTPEMERMSEARKHEKSCVCVYCELNKKSDEEASAHNLRTIQLGQGIWDHQKERAELRRQGKLPPDDDQKVFSRVV